MLETNVKQFASELGLQPDHLLEQLRAAGVGKSSMEDVLTEQDKTQLRNHLRRAHGGTVDNRVTLKRKETSEIRKADSTGKSRTIQVEVRKKRVVVLPEEEAAKNALPLPYPAAVTAEPAPVNTCRRTGGPGPGRSPGRRTDRHRRACCRNRDADPGAHCRAGQPCCCPGH